jgi:RNA polymerase sigma factor (sigma-70 family)
MTDTELIQRHLKGDEAAFADLVRRHVGWVHGMARRRVGAAQAEDVTQAVFIVLARQAPRLRPSTILPAWLFRITQFAAAKVQRSESRRRKHETEAAMARREDSGLGVQGSASEEWDALAPILDELVGRLRQSDREAILLRFYRQMTFPEVGATLDISEEAARKRVDRAVAKLREMASARGVTLPVGAFATVLLTNMAAEAATPVGLVATATTCAFGAGKGIMPASVMLAKGLTATMAATKTVTVVGAVAVVALLIGAGVIALAILPLRSSASVSPAPPPAPVAPIYLDLNIDIEQLEGEPFLEPSRIRVHYERPLRPEGPLPREGDIAVIEPGASRVDLSQFPDGAHHLYLIAEGFSPQWVYVVIEDRQLLSAGHNLTLYRPRYVVLRYAINTSGGNELTGPNVREGRVALTHWGRFEAFGQDWQVWQQQRGRGKPSFGSVPFLSFHRHGQGFGFREASEDAKFEVLTEAPAEAAYDSFTDREAQTGLLLLCRTRGTAGYGKILVEEVTLERPAELRIFESRY